jgi:hypothetical protein
MTSRIVGSLAVGLNATYGATASGAQVLVGFSGLNLPGTQTIAGTDDWRVPFNTVAELRALGQPAALTDPRASFHDTFNSERGSWRSS